MEHDNQTRIYGMEIEQLNMLSASMAGLHEGRISPEYWHGYMCALALSPVGIPETEWLAMVLQGREGEESPELEDGLRQLLKGILEALHSGEFKPYFPGNDESWRSCQTGDWCEGFLTGTGFWPEDLQQQAGQELVALTLPVILFYNPAEYFQEHGAHLGEFEREDLLDSSFAFLPAGLREIPVLWQEVLQEEQDDVEDDGE